MGDLGTKSAVSGQDGHYQATLSESWEIWGPQGGYVAAVALRAAGAESPLPRPASFVCHYLRVAEFGPCEIRVESLRLARRAESLRVTVEQNGVPVLEGLVWTVASLAGIDHDAAPMPQVPPAEDVESWDAYWPGGEPPFPFWRNFDVRPVTPHPRSGHEPQRQRCWDGFGCAHRQTADSDWLLVDARSPLSHHALVAGQASIWSVDGRLLGSAMQQMLQRT